MPLSTLNEEQLKAATAPLGHNLIIASAGTGKTSTIVGRIGHLLNKGIDPSKILLLTFTNKASGEMITRLEKHFPKKTVKKIEAGTFHAVSYRWLKKIYPNIALKQQSELKTLFRSIYEKRNFSMMNCEVSHFSASFLYEQYSLYQNSSLDTFDNWFLEEYPEHQNLMDVYFDITQTFEKEKKEYGFASFNDLLLKIMEYLEDNDLGFNEVLVDEYQDTNTLQGAFIDKLKSPSLFCVGDYDQSIYAFNGANIENIATFSTRYKKPKVLTLKTNYRSTAPILSLANKVIEKNERIYPKSLEVGRKEIISHPKILKYSELYEQYSQIAKKIKESSTKRDEIAIIFRNNSSADGVEATLKDLGIKSKRKGGTSFFETKEIKGLLDFMTLLHNSKDMMAFIHLFEYPKGLGSSLAKEIFEAIKYFGQGDFKKGVLNPTIFELPKFNPNKNRQLGLFEDDFEIGSKSRFNTLNLDKEVFEHPILKHPKITNEGVLFFQEFYRLFKITQNISSPSTILQNISKSAFYGAIISTLINQRSKLKTGEIDEKKRKEAKDKIQIKVALLFKLSKNYNEIGRFLNAMILGGGELSEGVGVNLLTVHASKGLEFKDVFVIDLVDGRFPNSKMMTSLEEERRLFYVAVTRAKDRLFLSYASYDKSKKKEYKPSEFLKEAGFSL